MASRNTVMIKCTPSSLPPPSARAHVHAHIHTPHTHAPHTQARFTHTCARTHERAHELAHAHTPTLHNPTHARTQPHTHTCARTRYITDVLFKRPEKPHTGFTEAILHSDIFVVL